LATALGTPAQSAVSQSALVTVAFRLGWHVAELYARDLARQQPAPPAKPPEDLPGLSSLSKHERDALLADQIAVDIHLLTSAFDAARITAADPQPLIADLNDLTKRAAAVKLLMLELHKQLLRQLWSADFRLGKAYGLGRALADTALLPRAADADGFEGKFERERVRNLVRWLGDLATTFPDHTAEAVAYSLKQWTAWAAAHPRLADGSIEASANGRNEIDRHLRAQGRLWRALLSGEKCADDLLGPGDFVSAAEEVVSSTAHLAWTFTKKWKWVLLVSLAALAGLLTTFFVFLTGGSKAATVIATILAAAGLSWKGIGTTLGKVLNRAEQPIWKRELARAAAIAATELPPH
jgi:hypothetical protein